MITRITGTLNRVLDDEARIQVGGLEYQVLVPEFVRRQLQMQPGHEVTLFTSHFFEGNPMQGRVVPRLIGFLSETELEFFDLFCTVDKVGIRKALKALVRPVRDIANAIQRQDSKYLTTLPGVGAATAEQIVTALKRKVTRYALGAETVEQSTAVGENGKGKGKEKGTPAPTAVVVAGNVIEEAYQALMAVGLNPVEARNRLDSVLTGGRAFTSVQEIITEIYKRP
jgi:holliday junction DNA helicase RuvA